MFERAYETMGVDTSDSTMPRLASLRDAIKRAGIESDTVMGSYPAVQTIIKTASKEAGLSRWVFGAWQLSSGSAHGKTWAGAHTSTFAESKGASTEEVLSGVLTSDETSIARILYAAIAVVDRAVGLQAQRAKHTAVPGASFMSPTPCGR